MVNYFFLREEKKRRKRTFRPGELFHFQIKPDNTDAYQSYLMVMPGKMLAMLYDEYGARLLEQNVRCFLQFRGNVNKGIRNTIRNDPEMFFAYNNGITATAEDIDFEQSNEGLKIRKLKNLQIVNGGQTTASIFSAKKKDKMDLGKIFVQVKLSIVDPERSVDVVPKISEYANSQNKVNAADFFANHPYHVRMEEFSRRLWTRPKEGELRQTKWFYERARGQYLDAQAHLTPASRKKFKGEYPKPQMFTKTDMAKFINGWEDCPHTVSKGAQKNFASYASGIGKKWDKDEKAFNELYFKHLVAKAIVFRATEKLIMKQPWYGGGYRANIVVYSIAWIANKVSSMKKVVNFSKIWETQKITKAFYETLEDVSYLIHKIITDTPESISNVTEWCKKEGCWLKVKTSDMDLNKAFISELIEKEIATVSEKDAKKVQKIDDGINAQAQVLNLGPEKWEKLSVWGLSEKLLTEKDIGILQVAVGIPDKIPSEKQSMHLMKLLAKMEVEGFQFK